MTDGGETNFVDYCKLYKIDGSCGECILDFIIADDGSKCLYKAENEDCLVFSISDSKKCVKCQEQYGLVPLNGSQGCLKVEFEHCKTTNQEELKNQVECLECDPNYYFDSQELICKLGHVSKCQEFVDNDPNNCKTCEEGYALLDGSLLYNKVFSEEMERETLTLENGLEVEVVQPGQATVTRNYCLLIPESLQCKEGVVSKYKSSPIDSPQFKCNVCTTTKDLPVINNEPVASNSPIDNLCFQLNEVANCEVYNVEMILADSNFVCTRCKKEFYLTRNGSGCEQRENLDPHCVQFDFSADKCLLCQFGYYPSEDGLSCQEYNKGIPGCKEYFYREQFQDTKCKKCVKEDYYLKDEGCFKTFATLSNCATVLDKFTCETCEEGFYLSERAKVEGEESLNNECLQIQLPNCLVQEDL